MLSATWICKRFSELFSENLADVAQNTDIDLTDILLGEKLVQEILHNPEEAIFLRENFVTHYLPQNINNHIHFNKQALSEWAADALRFCEANQKHSNFVHIFSAGTHFGPAIESTLVFNFSTEPLGRFLSFFFDKRRLVPDARQLSRPLQAAVRRLARDAIEPTLFSLGLEITQQKIASATKRETHLNALQRIEKHPSFKDTRGLIRFVTKQEGLDFAGTEQRSKIEDYRNEVSYSLKRMNDKRILERVHNKDPDLADLISEYKKHFSISVTDQSPVRLCTLGKYIAERVVHNSDSDPDERIDESCVFEIKMFLNAHNLYIQGFQVVEEMTQDWSRSARIYEQLDAASKNLPWNLLVDLSDRRDILSPDARSTISIMTKAPDIGRDAPKDSISVLRLGILRGILRAMGLWILQKIRKIIQESAEDKIDSASKNFLKNEIEEPIVKFFKENYGAIIKLPVVLPIFFEWIKGLVSIIS
jgi:hypothetical protein